MLSLLREQILEVIATCAAPAIRMDLVNLLERPGYALHAEGLCRAGSLALDVHEAVFSEPPGKSPLLAAAALELQMEAAYLFDEVADAAHYEKRSEDLALAIALLTAGGAAAVEAAAVSADPSDALRHFCMDYNEACAGQFLDALMQRREEATLEEALQMTCLKSGGLGKFVTGFAARVAGVDPVGVTLFEQLGSDTFTLAQLVDDLRDACAPGEDSDLLQRKATLPVVYFRQGIDSMAPFDGMLPSDLHQIYESSGAPLYAAILARAYMSRARQDLSLLARRAYAVGGLGRFLKSVEAGAEEILGAACVGLVA